MTQRTATLLCLFLTALPAGAQTASLVADLNPAAGVPTGASQILLVPGKTFFVSGDAPWVSDGTQAGTRMLTEACPDFCGDVIRMLGALDGVVLWISEDQGFWRSDGTRSGTYRLDGPEAGFSLTGEGVFLGGAYITRGFQAFNGCSLWRTDGTVAGTRAVESVPPDQSGQEPESLTAAGSKVFFVRSPGAQTTLWVTDGTAAGTRQLVVLPPSPGFPGAWIEGLTAVGDRVFFGASSNEDDEVWTSDGTPAGTHTVTHFPQPEPFGTLGQGFSLQASGQRVYFSARNGPGAGLWRSDGTSQGTQQIANPPIATAALKSSSGGGPDFVEEVAGGRAIFRDFDGRLWVTNGNPATAAPLQCGGPCPALSSLISLHGFGQRAVFVTAIGEIWGTDGTAAGTHKLGSCMQFPCPVYQNLQAWPQGIGFVGFDAAHGTELWVTDGMPAGTRRLTNVPGRDLGVERAPVAATDGHRVVVLGPIGSDGRALWVADAAGTRLLAALPREGGSSYPMDFQPLASDPSGLLFSACVYGGSVWRTDGTAAGTVALAPGTADLCGAGVGLTPLASSGLVFFQHATGFNVRDLWRTDGTGPGTLQLTTGGNVQAEPMAAFQGKLFFAVNTAGGPAVWKSDGTAAGTVQAFQVPASDEAGEITGLTALAGSLWLVLPNQGDDEHSELWRSDGTQAGTVRIGGIPGAAPPLAGLGNQVFFLGQGPAHGRGSIWRTDGTPAGTYALNNDYAGEGVFDQPQMAVAGGSLYFIARPGASGLYRWTLYKSDGTPQGTAPLVQIITTSADKEPPAHLTAAAGRLFFVADDGVHGRELWTTDGTAAGTRLVRDIAPGSQPSNPDWLAAAGDLLYFSADDGVHGAELWRSDGTEAGTRLAQDIAPEAASSFPQRLTALGDRLWLSADDGATGRELWSLPLTAPATCHPSPDRLCLGGSAGGRYQVEASWHTADGARGRGTAVALTADTGTFWFFSPTNVETVVKVLDGTGVNGHVWVFYGALSNVEYTLTVTDTQTGLTRRYFNPQGQLASVGDIYAFGPLGAKSRNPEPLIAPPSPAPQTAVRTDPRTVKIACDPTPGTLCLGGRFAVSVAWKDFQGHIGNGTAVPLSADTGTFWFFNAANVELVVKALDGRPVNNHFWLFYGALSNVEYTLTVTDIQTGTTKTYNNPAGRFASVADTLAF